MMIESVPVPSLPSAFVSTILASDIWKAFAQHCVFPEGAALGGLLNESFFGSLEKEEGRHAQFSIAIEPRISAHFFAEPLPLNVENLRKLSAACDRDATLLTVTHHEGRWLLMGVAVNHGPRGRGWSGELDNYLVLTVREPGSIILRWNHVVLFSFAHGCGIVPNNNDWLSDIVGEILPNSGPSSLGIQGRLSSMFIAMRSHGRGGALLVVPEEAPSAIKFAYKLRVDARPLTEGQAGEVTVYHEAMSWPTPPADAAAREIRSRLRRENISDEDPAIHITMDRLHRRAIEETDDEAALVGRLTAVDGIVAINHKMCVLGFGGKIPVKDDFLDTIVVSIDPHDRSRASKPLKEVFKGMRHNSAALACQRAGAKSLALVQSQDGPLTLIICRPNEELWVIGPLENLQPFLEF